jgi:hypothetical protein
MAFGEIPQSEVERREAVEQVGTTTPRSCGGSSQT